MAIPKARPPRLKPLRVRLAHGGEVDFHGDVAKLRRMYPDATIVSFADGSKYVKAEQDTQPEASTVTEPAKDTTDGAASETKHDSKSATGKGGGTKTQTKATGSGEDAG